MHSIARLAVAIAASLSLTVALAAEPAYAAHNNAHRVTRPAARPAPTPRLTAAQARAILIRAARHHGLNPNFVLAVSYWESGWNQAARSYTGAVGLMRRALYRGVGRSRAAPSARESQQSRRQRRARRCPVAVVPRSPPQSEAGARRLLSGTERRPATRDLPQQPDVCQRHLASAQPVPGLSPGRLTQFFSPPAPCLACDH